MAKGVNLKEQNMRTVSLPVVEPGVLSRLWTRLYGTNRWLALSAAAYTILFFVTIFLAIVDARLVTDAPVWFKPMKFALSSVLYTGTLAWILSFVESKKFWVKLVDNIQNKDDRCPKPT